MQVQGNLRGKQLWSEEEGNELPGKTKQVYSKSAKTLVFFPTDIMFSGSSRGAESRFWSFCLSWYSIHLDMFLLDLV